MGKNIYILAFILLSFNIKSNSNIKTYEVETLSTNKEINSDELLKEIKLNIELQQKIDSLNLIKNSYVEN